MRCITRFRTIRSSYIGNQLHLWGNEFKHTFSLPDVTAWVREGCMLQMRFRAKENTVSIDRTGGIMNSPLWPPWPQAPHLIWCLGRPAEGPGWEGDSGQGVLRLLAVLLLDALGLNGIEIKGGGRGAAYCMITAITSSPNISASDHPVSLQRSCTFKILWWWAFCEGCWGYIYVHVGWKDVTKPAKFSIFRTKVTPLGKAVGFIHHNANKARDKWGGLQQPLEPAVWLHKLLGTNNNHAVMKLANCLPV